MENLLKREPKREPRGYKTLCVAIVSLDALAHGWTRNRGVKEATDAQFRPSPPVVKPQVLTIIPRRQGAENRQNNPDVHQNVHQIGQAIRIRWNPG
jgi:hypothetical protein